VGGWAWSLETGSRIRERGGIKILILTEEGREGVKCPQNLYQGPGALTITSEVARNTQREGQKDRIAATQHG